MTSLTSLKDLSLQTLCAMTTMDGGLNSMDII